MPAPVHQAHLRIYVDRKVTQSRESREKKFKKANDVRKRGGGMAGTKYLCGEEGYATAFGMDMIVIDDKPLASLHGAC